MKFKSCAADIDVWYRPAITSDSVKYYQYVLLHTNDILAIAEDPETFIQEELDSYFVVKKKSIGKPTQYLGTKVTEVQLENGQMTWSFSSS